MGALRIQNGLWQTGHKLCSRFAFQYDFTQLCTPYFLCDISHQGTRSPIMAIVLTILDQTVPLREPTSP
jgi:hypothetical protein